MVTGRVVRFVKMPVMAGGCGDRISDYGGGSGPLGGH